MVHFVARFASTPLDVIEGWSLEKLLLHFEAAMRLHEALNRN